MKKIVCSVIENALKIMKKNFCNILYIENISYTLSIESKLYNVTLVFPYPILKNEKKIYKEYFYKCIKEKLSDIELKIFIKFNVPHYKVNNRNNVNNIKNVIVVSSGKGGVGKSTISSNIAFSMRTQGARVGILDMDIYGPSMPLILSTKNKIPKYIGHKIEPIYIFGIQTISIGNLIDYDSPIVWRGPMVSSAVNKLFYDTNWKNLDYLIVDLPPGTGDIHLTLIKNIPITAALLVSTPQSLSVFDTVKAYHMFYKTKIPILGIVENMSHFECDKCGKQHDIFDKNLERKFAQYRVPKLISLPIDTDLRKKSDNGRIKDIYRDKKSISHKFIKLSKIVLHKLNLLPISNTLKIRSL